MEGANSGKSGALIPFVWSPGWNSNQSIHKFQSEAGGALAGGTPGVRLIETGSNSSTSRSDIPEKSSTSNDTLELLPLYKIFGSDELTAQSPPIQELTLQPTITLNPNDADRLGLKQNDAVLAKVDQDELHLDVAVNSSIPTGCAGYLVGVPGTRWLAPNSSTSLKKTSPKLKVENGGQNV